MIVVRGFFDVWYYEHGKPLWKETVPNGAVLVGRNAMLDGMFNAGSPGANWYLGLIDNSAFDEFADADTMSSHAGWTEFTSYTAATRPAWGHGSASSGVVLNSTLTTFTMSAIGTIKGLFLASDNTKGGTSGTLWATGAFATPRSVASGGVLPIRYRTVLSAG